MEEVTVKICPKCGEIITVINEKKFAVCSCGEVVSNEKNNPRTHTVS
jgi:hypothetical protein